VLVQTVSYKRSLVQVVVSVFEMVFVHVVVRQSDAGGVPGSTVVDISLNHTMVVVGPVTIEETVVIGIVTTAGE
jgi:hypothetical protein